MQIISSFESHPLICFPFIRCHNTASALVQLFLNTRACSTSSGFGEGYLRLSKKLDSAFSLFRLQAEIKSVNHYNKPVFLHSGFAVVVTPSSFSETKTRPGKIAAIQDHYRELPRSNCLHQLA